jgi:hypothetical protein
MQCVFFLPFVVSFYPRLLFFVIPLLFCLLTLRLANVASGHDRDWTEHGGQVDPAACGVLRGGAGAYGLLGSRKDLPVHSLSSFLLLALCLSLRFGSIFLLFFRSFLLFLNLTCAAIELLWSLCLSHYG